ncbi:MAG: hypothetical protein ABSB19_03430 [Methylomonas sp.]|jgi:hypothetical protein
MKTVKYVSLLMALWPYLASADFPEGQWIATNNRDIGGTDIYPGLGFCIVKGGYWYGTDVIKGKGQWAQNGDAIHLHMNRQEANGILFESVELNIIDLALMTGYWQQWDIQLTENGYFTTKWLFVSPACKPPI